MTFKSHPAASSDIPLLLDHQPTRTQPLRVVQRPPLGRRARIEAHKHPWPQITFALEGIFRVSTPSHSWIVPPNRAIWIPAMVEHEVVTLSSVVMHAVRVGRRLQGKWRRTQVIEVTPLLRECIVALRAMHESRRQAARAAALGELVLDEIRHSATLPLSIPLPRDKRLRNLCEQLIAVPQADLTLAQWARRVGASSRTLERLFKEELGVTFLRWRQGVRLAHGIALMSQGRSIAYAATAAGYHTQSAFTAMFRNAFGRAPRDFFRASGDSRELPWKPWTSQLLSCKER